MRKLSTIIVNYNTAELLEKCLNNLRDAYPLQELIVVDNGSSDGSAQMIKEKFPDILLVENENKGLAVGNNLGMQRASGDYFLFLGTDAFPNKEVIGGMIGYMEQHPEVGVATPKLLLRDGSIDMHAHRGFPTPWASLTYLSRLYKIFPKSKLFGQYYLGYKDMGKEHEIDLCIAHFMLVRKEVFDKIGKWCEDYFLYGEDVDFCYRVKESGFKIMYLPQFEVLHYKGASVGIRKETRDITTASPETVIRMKKETTRAMRLFYEKHYKNKYPQWLTGLVLFGIGTLDKLREKGLFFN